MEQLILSLVSGAVGGNLAGGLLKNLNLGVLGNSVAGILGGGIGGQVLSAAAAGTFTGTSLFGQVAAGGVGGAIVLAVVGALKNMLAK